MSDIEPNTEADLPIEQFVERGNIRDTGKEPPPLDQKPTDADKTDDDKPEPDTAAPDSKVIQAPAIDKRTREGKKLSIQQEIDQLTATKHTTKREIEAATAELTRLRAEQADLAKPKPPQPKSETVTEPEWKRYRAMADAPDIKDFENYEDYSAALSFFIAEKRFDERMAQRDEKQSVMRRVSTWRERLNAAKAKDPALMSRVVGTTPATDQMTDFMMDSEHGVDIMLYLSDHQDLAQRLSTLHPLKVAEEMGKLEAQIEARQRAAVPAQPPTRPISQARPPIKPVDGAPLVSDADADDGELPIEEFVRRGNQNDPAINPRAVRH